MEAEEITKAQAAIERCIRRFEKIEKTLQQPWRIVRESTRESLQVSIKALNGMLPEFEKRTNEYVKTILLLHTEIARGMELKIKVQNLHKAIGTAILPFGTAPIGNL